MKIHEYWNDCPGIQADDETCSFAEDCDYLKYISGYVFLLQRKNEHNNIIMYALKPSAPLGEVLKEYVCYLIKNKIQYVRIEGCKKRYRLFPKIFGKQAFFENVETRSILYAKLY